MFGRYTRKKYAIKVKEKKQNETESQLVTESDDKSKIKRHRTKNQSNKIANNVSADAKPLS